MKPENSYLSKLWGRTVASRCLYAWIPYLRYAGLNGSLARGAAKSASDIDIMVVAEQGHIFTVRFFMLVILGFVGVKRNQTSKIDRLCVNYFVTSDNLDLKPHNFTVADSYTNMVALVDSEVGKSYFFHEKIMRQNRWMNKYCSLRVASNVVDFKPLLQPWQFIRRLLEILLWPISSILEKVLKKLQIAKIMRHPLTAKNADKIVVGDKELMFHPRKHR